ncbi:DsbA family oxidoreductase [Paenibacillus sp. GXUN7292]|uniref:DsbA family oxidoreductase n=1 Tax=Paenibacillus sp. GXUN7292 TaxID=3422499 RepID=UPI003D7E3ECE
MKNNPMACDLTTGICGDAGESGVFELVDLNAPVKKIDLYYATDPICSHCWALEPVMRKFVKQYSKHLNIRTIAGGLLAGWDGFADVKNGIGKPSDVAGHWREVGAHSRMPIDGSVWEHDPIMSSYPPSKVFKVIGQQDEKLASVFLRRAREAVFAFDRNIGKEEVLIDIVNGIGLNGEGIVAKAGEPAAQELLEQDFALAASLGVRGFPTIIMVNEDKKGVKIVGAQTLEHYAAALEQVLGEKPAAEPMPALASLLQEEKLLFSKEIETAYDIDRDEVQTYAEQQLAGLPYKKQELLGELYYTLETAD